ncbi:MAG: pilus assembly protein PilE [Gammaproteobacteria bacterium]|nr:pilus assembly protein PilE [Gammaproteobacteria bacterium]
MIVIVSILSMIAYPSYLDSIRKSRRADGQAALLDAAHKMEAFYARNATYSTTLADSNISATSPETFYSGLVIAKGNTGNIATSYILTISANGSQDDDTISKYRLSSTGLKQQTENGTTWENGW